MIKRILLKLVAYPPLLDLIRYLIEAGHRGERKVIEAERQYLKGKLLDLPCGTGTFSDMFADEDYTGLDLDPKFIERARIRRPTKKFEQGDALNLNYPDGTFDSLLVIGFLHHLDEAGTKESLAEMRRVLNDKGSIVLIEDCPTRDWWNIPGRILQQLDEGGRIRSTDFYLKLLPEYFTVEKHYPMRAGLWDYSVYILTTSKQ